MEGSIEVRVRYVECDAMGVAHHSSYIAWLEMGRTELLRSTGRTYAALERAGTFLVVTRLELWYRRPVRYDDVVEVTTRVERATRFKIVHAYELRLREREGADVAELVRTGDDLLAGGTTTLASVDRESRPTPLADWLRGSGRSPD